MHSCLTSWNAFLELLFFLMAHRHSKRSTSSFSGPDGILCFWHGFQILAICTITPWIGAESRQHHEKLVSALLGLISRQASTADQPLSSLTVTIVSTIMMMPLWKSDSAGLSLFTNTLLLALHGFLCLWTICFSFCFHIFLHYQCAYIEELEVETWACYYYHFKVNITLLELQWKYIWHSHRFAYVNFIGKRRH